MAIVMGYCRWRKIVAVAVASSHERFAEDRLARDNAEMTFVKTRTWQIIVHPWRRSDAKCSLNPVRIEKTRGWL